MSKNIVLDKVLDVIDSRLNNLANTNTSPNDEEQSLKIVCSLANAYHTLTVAVPPTGRFQKVEAVMHVDEKACSHKKKTK